MNKRSMFLFLVVLLSTLLAACGQQEANEVMANTDGKLVAISDAITTELNEVGQYGESCQLSALGRQMGSDNKIAFLLRIRKGCTEVSASANTDWESAWSALTDMSVEEYKAAQ